MGLQTRWFQVLNRPLSRTNSVVTIFATNFSNSRTQLQSSTVMQAIGRYFNKLHAVIPTKHTFVIFFIHNYFHNVAEKSL